MKLLLIAAAMVGFSLGPGISPGHASCRVTVAASVEVSGKFSLADLLGSSGCPELRRAAAKVLLGGAPLAGSERVLAGSELLANLQKLAANLEGASASAHIFVPERITVRRAGARASCVDIARRIPQASSGVVECGAADRVPQDATLEFSRPAWDPALASWQLYARCVHPADCVPFVVRLSAQDSRPDSGTPDRKPQNAMLRTTLARLAADPSPSSGRAASEAERMLPLVRPGQTVTLLWDQDGIRLVVPAVCLDRGVPGEKVRARMGHGGAIVPAIVVSAGMLRAAS